MKRLLSALLTIILMLSLGGCGSDGYSPERNSDYITLGAYKNLIHQMADTTVSDYALEIASNKKLLAHGYAETQSDLNLKTGTVQLGDTVHLTYSSKIDGKDFDESSGEGNLVIGSGDLIPGFEEGLLGAQVGKKLTLNLTFPRSYSDGELAGKAVCYEVTVNAILSRITYSKLTDEIAEQLGYTSLADYQENLKNEVSADLIKQADEEKITLLWNQVLESATIEEPLPTELMEVARNDWMRRYTASANQFGYDTIAEYLTANHLGDYSTLINQETKATVRNLLAARAIAEAEGFILTDAVIEEKAAEYAKSASYASTEKYIADIGESMIEYRILLDYAQEIVVENAIIK